MPRRLISITAMLVVCGLWFIVVANYRDGEGPTLVEAVARPTPGDLDPTPYRAEIEAIETILYARHEPGWQTADMASAAVMKLGSSIARRARHPEVREVGARVLTLGSRFGAEADAGYAMPDLARMRRDWETLRNEIFRPAAWFRGNLRPAAPASDHAAALAQRATLALDAAQTPAAPDPVPRREMRRYERLIDELGQQADRGQRQCESLGEPDYDISVPTAHSEKHVASWFAWSREWEGELFDAWDDAPARPGFDAQPELLSAHQKLEQALRDLQMVPRGAGMWPTPFQGQWEQRFASARVNLEEARAYLADVAVE